jgi:hypothetical protein
LVTLGFSGAGDPGFLFGAGFGGAFEGLFGEAFA